MSAEVSPARVAARVAYAAAADEVRREARWQVEQGNDPERWLMVERLLRYWSERA